MNAQLDLSVAINSCIPNPRRIAAPNWLENRVTNGKFSREEEGLLVFHHHCGANLHTPPFALFS